MQLATSRVDPDPATLFFELDRHRRLARWDASAEFVSVIPDVVDGPWLRVADEVAFALGKLRRTDEAIALLLKTYEREPTHRRASAIAFHYYSVLMEGPPPGTRRDRDADRRAFLCWIGRALEHKPGAIKDLYRLGVFEARIESRHDLRALRAFDAAIASYRAMSAHERQHHHHLRVPYIRSLYAAARSALALGRHADARRAIFACIREDETSHHVAPLHKLHLAGKVCMATDELGAAERAFRLALDCEGPRERAFVHVALAELAARRDDLQGARGWIDNIPPHRRDSHAWRLLGDILLRSGDRAGARNAWDHALRRDRAGRHLTLVRLGDLHAHDRDLRAAERCYVKAREFRRRTYQSEDASAIRGLATIYERTARPADARALQSLLRDLDHGGTCRRPR